MNKILLFLFYFYTGVIEEAEFYNIQSLIVRLTEQKNGGGATVSYDTHTGYIIIIIHVL